MKRQQTLSSRIRTAARWSMVRLGLDSFLLSSHLTIIRWGQDSGRPSPRGPQVGFWKVSPIGNDKRACVDQSDQPLDCRQFGSDPETGFEEVSDRAVSSGLSAKRK